MANAFDAANAPEGEPKEVVVGDFIQWKRSDLITDYPTATHSAEYVARISGGGATEIKLPMTEQSDHYLATVDSVTSSAFLPGHYYWQLEITQTSSGNRIVVDRGDFTAIADLDVNQADPRSHAEIMLAKIESLLQGKADSDVASYSIQGRSLTKLSFEELEKARSRYKAEIKNEKALQAAKQGRKTGNTVRVVF